MAFYSARRLDRGFNIFYGILKNYYFLIIFLISASHLTLLCGFDPLTLVMTCLVVGGQILIIEVGGAAFQVVPLGGRDWGISLVLGFLSIPLAALVKLLNPAPFEKFMIRYHLAKDPNAVLPITSPHAEEQQWNEGKFVVQHVVETATDSVRNQVSAKSSTISPSLVRSEEVECAVLPWCSSLVRSK